jgi:magnesium transporter
MSENLEAKVPAQPASYAEIPSEAPVFDSDYALNSSFVRSVIDALDSGDDDRVQRLVMPLHAADLADLLGLVRAIERRNLLEMIGTELNLDVLSELDEDVLTDVLKQLEPPVIASALQAMDSDDAVQLIEGLTEEEREAVLKLVPRIDRAAVEQLLAYEEDCAGRLMQREMVTVPPYWSVGQTIDHMRATKGLPEQFFEIYIVDESFHPIGSVPLSRLMQAKREVTVRELMDTEQTLIPAIMDQGEAAYLFNQYHLLSAAVTDDAGRLVGMITVDDIVEVITEEDTEDILYLGGVKQEGLSDGVFKTTQRRFSWLLINLVTAILASVVIALFDATIEKFIALAILMPIVASMGGNAGTQTLTVAVRAIATRDLTPSNAVRIIFREVMVGGLNGIMFAILMGAVGAIWFQSPILGVILAGAMIANLLCAGAAGILVPLGLQRAGMDPAIGSTVFVTTATDLVGFFVFLGLGALALS